MTVRGLLAGGIAAALITAAPAGAAVVATNAPCYLTQSQMAIGGQGFAPGAPISAEGMGLFGSTTADASGAFSLTTTAPLLPFTHPGAKTYTVTAGDGTTAAQTTFRVTNFAARTKPRSPRKPGTTVRWTVSGFAPGSHVYAHYVHHGHQRRRVSFGHMPRTCGTLHRTLRMLPIADAPTGRWRIQLDNRRRYRTSTSPKLVVTGTVYRHLT